MAAMPESVEGFKGLQEQQPAAGEGGKVKYYYFGLQARGLPGLLTLEVGGVDYEGHRVEFGDWKAMKESGVCPMGYLPLLILPDGTEINETCAITNIAGHLAKLKGETLRDCAISEMLSAKAAEVFNDAAKTFPRMKGAKSPEEIEQGKVWVETDLKKVLDLFEALCKKNEALYKEGKFTTSGKTCGELHLFSTLHQIQGAGAALPPGLGAFYKRLAGDEAVKKVLSGGTQMGEQVQYLTPFDM